MKPKSFFRLLMTAALAIIKTVTRLYNANCCNRQAAITYAVHRSTTVSTHPTRSLPMRGLFRLMAPLL